MAVPDALLPQLLALDQPQRSAIAHALLSLSEIERIEIAHALLHDEDDGMTAQERAQLDAVIDQSLEELRAGKRGVPAKEVIASLRARQAARRAAHRVAR
jgi:hypothetical protein